MSIPAAARMPADASASSDTSVRVRPIFASRRDVPLVRRDHIETTSAPIVAMAQAATGG